MYYVLKQMLLCVFICPIRCLHWLLKDIKQSSDTRIMELFPNGPKHVKDLIQSGDLGYADSQGNREPNANWAVKPNVNLNLNPVSSFHPHQTMDTSVLDGQNQNYLEAKPEGESVAKVAATIEAGKSGSLGTPVVSPVEKDHVLQQKSKIPALACSPMSEGQLNRKGMQRLKSPNLKHTPTLSPKALSNSKIAANPSNVRMAEREKSQVRKESGSSSIPNPHTVGTREETAKTANKSLKMNTSQKGEGEISRNTHLPTASVCHKLKEDSKLANKTPTLATQSQRPVSAVTMPDEKMENYSSCEGPIRSKLQNQRDGMVLLGTKNPDLSSQSPRPSTERKTTGTTTRNASRSKENINSKDSSIASSSKTQSKDSLDSKSGSVSKTSLGSKDSLDLKTCSSSNCKSGKGSRDIHSKTAVDSSKLRPVLHTSKSAAADLSLPLPLSPRPISAKRSPGSAPKSLGSSGPSREAQRSPGAARG